jgi:hypothetical protein
MKCTGCGGESKYTIQLARGPHGKEPLKAMTRYYLPNSSARDPEHLADLGEIPFCHECMRRVEDNLRGTILYLQAEHSLLKIEPVAGDPR